MREHINLIELAQDDVSANSLSDKAWLETYSYIYNNGELHNVEYSGKSGVCIFMRDINVDPVFHKTCLAFLQTPPMTDRSASTHFMSEPFFGCRTLVIFLVADASKTGIERYLIPNRFKFIHEMIHVMDDVRYKTPNTKSVDPKNKEEYFNDTAELNAYFHNIAEPLLDMLSMVKKEGLDVLELYPEIPTDFRAFLADRVKKLHFEPLKQFWAHLNDRNRKRLISRLHALHAEYVKLVNQLKTSQG